MVIPDVYQFPMSDGSVFRVKAAVLITVIGVNKNNDIRFIRAYPLESSTPYSVLFKKEMEALSHQIASKGTLSWEEKSQLDLCNAVVGCNVTTSGAKEPFYTLVPEYDAIVSVQTIGFCDGEAVKP
jgi:hypothetical protein